jgi:hypothetical protein
MAFGNTPPLQVANSFVVPGGHVQAHCSDRAGLVGLLVSIPRSFWNSVDLQGYGAASFKCTVVAVCDRDFCHADGTRTATYLIEHHGQNFPIKRKELIEKCLTQAQRASLQLN